jgi:hypothetical protein
MEPEEVSQEKEDFIGTTSWEISSSFRTEKTTPHFHARFPFKIN